MLNNLTHNFNEICAGTSNHLDPVFIEASKENLTNNNKMLDRLGRMMASYEKFYGAKKGSIKPQLDKDMEAIAKSKGDIDKILGGKLKKVLDQLFNITSLLAPGGAFVNSIKNKINYKELEYIYKALEETKEVIGYIKKYKSYYEKSYDKKITLINQEYECSCAIATLGMLYGVVQANSMFASEKILKDMEKELINIGTNITHDKNIKYDKNKAHKQSKVIGGIIHDLLKELKSSTHVKYLEVMIKAKDNKPIKESYEIDSILAESSVTEIAVAINTIRESLWGIFKYGTDIVNTVIRTITGIVPLIRSIIFLNYKKKVDAINSLEEQIEYLEMNINQLKNIKTGNKKEVAHRTEIIKKQSAIIEQMKKKAYKMKEEFGLLEDEVEEDINKSNAELKNDSIPPVASSSDDDFVLD